MSFISFPDFSNQLHYRDNDPITSRRIVIALDRSRERRANRDTSGMLKLAEPPGFNYI
ncbi:MAG: hypothetical protein ACPW60_10820 [Methylohalobius sp. ZOD2]|nr:hypothetical protein [Methylothermaceae bacterium]